MIFLVVAANLTLSLVEATEAYSSASVVLEAKSNPTVKEIIQLDPAVLDPVLMKNSDLIKDFGWVSVKVNEQEYNAYSQI
jgi:hypothetical protein